MEQGDSDTNGAMEGKATFCPICRRCIFWRENDGFDGDGIERTALIGERIIGVSIGAAILGTIPNPTHRINWGENIPPHVKEALRNGETAMLVKGGKDYALILMDYFGTIREKLVIPSDGN